MANRVLVCGFGISPSERVVDDFLRTPLLWSGNDEALRSPYTIETKYYSAPLEFYIPKVLPESEEAITAALSSAQALLLLLDPDQTDQFNRIKLWQEPISNVSVPVSVCIALSSSKKQLNEAKRAPLVDFCVDTQMEFIDYHEARPENQDEREKYGPDRVLEALHNNMWPEMARKYQKDSKKGDPAPAAASQASVHLPPTAPDLSSGGMFSGMAIIPDQQNANSSRKASSNPLSAMASLLDKLNSDDDMALDLAIEEMVRMKAHASTLPDRERKEFAAKIALQFAQMLKSEDDDDDLTIDDLDDSLKDFHFDK